MMSLNKCAKFCTSLVRRIHFSSSRNGKVVPSLRRSQRFYESQINRDSREILLDPQITWEESHKILLMQARNSLIFELKTEKVINTTKHAKKIENFFSNIGEIYHFSPLHIKMNTYIVQFKDRNSVSYILNRGNDGTIDSHMVTIKVGKEFVQEFEENEEEIKSNKDKELYDLLDKQEDMDAQIDILVDRLSLPSSQIRVRYLVLHVLQQKFNKYSMGKSFELYPFGSSLTGAGRVGSDMDIVLLSKDYQDTINSPLPYEHKLMLDVEGDIRMRIKETTVEILHLAESLISLHMSEAKNLDLLLGARVPILKFDLPLLNLSVDISVNAMQGLSFAQVINWYVKDNPQVLKVLLIIREWAETRGLLSHGVTNGLTPFMLQILILAFLIRIKELPRMDRIGRIRRDKFIMQRSPQSGTASSKSTEQLICEFFKYFANYSITHAKASLAKRQIHYRFSQIPLFLVNPFDTKRNMSSNVCKESVVEASEEIKKASKILEFRRKKLTDRDWGLNALLKKS